MEKISKETNEQHNNQLRGVRMMSFLKKHKNVSLAVGALAIAVVSGMGSVFIYKKAFMPKVLEQVHQGGYYAMGSRYFSRNIQRHSHMSLTSSPTLKKEIPTKVGWYKLTPSHRFLIHRQCQRILSTDLISHQSNGTTRSIDKTSNVGNKKISPYIPYLKRRGFTASWINQRLNMNVNKEICKGKNENIE